VIEERAVHHSVDRVHAVGHDSVAFTECDGVRVVEVDDLTPFVESTRDEASTAEDAGESGMTQITSPAFATREHGTILSAAGYRDWPGEVAHLSVLTIATARGRGLARTVASAAITHAIQHGKLPQWRARPPASRRVARVLGFRELGSQVSIRIAHP